MNSEDNGSITSNNRADFEEWGDWYVDIELSRLYWDFINSLRGCGLASRRTWLKRLEAKVENSVAMEFYIFYNGNLEKVAEELWNAVEIPLYRSKLDLVYLLSIEWLRKNVKSNKNVRKEFLEKT